MTIYNRDGKSVNMQVPEKPINYILVLVLDGDEAAVVFFGDLSSVYLDEKPDRKVGQFNTSYIVNKDVLDAWMSYKPVSTENAAFERKRFVESITQGGFYGKAD